MEIFEIQRYLFLQLLHMLRRGSIILFIFAIENGKLLFNFLQNYRNFNWSLLYLSIQASICKML